jgi:uncharacterized membrane protein YeiH
MIYALDLFGVVVFAITGALAARDHQLDLFGVMLLSLVTALGGGTLRDVLIGQTPVFWIEDTTYVLVVITTSITTFLLLRSAWLPRRTLLIADAFGLAVFSVLGAQTSLKYDISPLIAIIMGVMSGVAGGIIRDLLSDKVPLILRHEIYATAAMAGAGVFVIIDALAIDEQIAMTAGVLMTLMLRLAAIRWKWSLPLYLPPELLE